VVKIPKICPSCGSNLYISRLTCPECATEISGTYAPDLFSNLPPNDFDFIVLFIRTKGNIKEMERVLGISYWSIRSKLNDIVSRLGFDPGDEEAIDPTTARQQILERLNAGLITVQEAAEQLERLKISKNNWRNP